MSEQTQQDDYEVDGDLEQVEEPIAEQESEDHHEDDSESSSDNTGKAPAKVEFTEEQQRIFDETVGSKVFKQREAERKAERLQKELDDLRSKQQTDRPPVVPEIRDAYSLTDDQLAAQMKDRDKAIRDRAEWDANQRAQHQRAEEIKHQAESARIESLRKNIETYSGRATTFGIKAEELKTAGDAVAGYGIHDDLVDFIITDDHGPLITKYLSRNPIELEALSQLSPAAAAVRIERIVRGKALALKPKVTQTPDPTDRPRGSGASPKEAGPKGATFE
jgi:hypothetical protein